jgi:hypothetical protein
MIIYDVAEQLGLEIRIDHDKSGKCEDIAWFSCTNDGVICVTEVPTASRLECFAKEFGITEKAKWLDTEIALLPVCNNIPPFIISSHALLRYTPAWN